MDETKTFCDMYELNIEEYENISIDEVEFSVRVNNRLHRGRINTISDLLKSTPSYLAELNGFGAGCFKEIYDYCETLKKKKQRSCVCVEDKKKIPEEIYNQRHCILSGDFSYVPEDDEAKEMFFACQEAYNILDKELIVECVDNPIYALDLERVFEQFAKSVSLANKLLEIIPDERKRKKVKLFINACTYTNSVKETLLALLRDDEETLEAYIRRNETELLSNDSAMAVFARDCAYDLYGMAEKLFNDVRKNERAFEVVKLRAEGQTLEQVGNAFAVTRERIRQIEKKVSKTVINWINKYSVLKKIVAELDGEEVILPSDFDAHFKEYADIFIHFLKVYEDEVKNLIYDKSMDVFVAGNVDVITEVQAYVEELPEQFNEKRLEEILEKGEVICGYSPRRLLRKALELDYNKTGEVYHRSRLTLGKVYSDILSKYYLNGIWIYSDSELEEFRKHIREDYGEIKLPENNRAFIARIASVGILCGRGTYGPKRKQYISAELADLIHSYICESESPIFLMNTIYNVFEERLNEEGVLNKYYLQGILRELYGEEFVFRRDYVSKDSKLTSVYSEIVGYIEKASYPVTKKQINEAFPGVTEIVINISISDPDIINLFGVYIHSNKLQFEKADIEYIKDTILLFTKESEYIHSKNLYEYMQRDNPTLLTNNGICHAFGLYSVIEYLFKEIMEFSRPYIGRKGAIITRTFDQLHEMVEESDVIALADVVAVARENHFQINSILEFANSCSATHLLVNDKELAAIEHTGINEEIARNIEDSIAAEIQGTMYISDISCIHKFEKVNVPWTNWLIYSVILKWSTKLDVAVTSTTFRQAQPVIALRGQLETENIESTGRTVDAYEPDDLDNIDELISDIILEEIEV